MVEKICPMSFPAGFLNGCLKEKCALWNISNDCCALRLTSIVRILEKIHITIKGESY